MIINIKHALFPFSLVKDDVVSTERGYKAHGQGCVRTFRPLQDQAEEETYTTNAPTMKKF